MDFHPEIRILLHELLRGKRGYEFTQLSISGPLVTLLHWGNYEVQLVNWTSWI